jgi:hypothetical protein
MTLVTTYKSKRMQLGVATGLVLARQEPIQELPTKKKTHFLGYIIFLM